MNKKIVLSIIGVAGLVAVGAATYFVTKSKKKQNDQPVTNDDESIEENDEVILDDEDHFDIGDEEDSIIEDYFNFLIDNFITEPEASSVVETIREIKKNLPEKYLEVCEEMREIMNNEFDLEKSLVFDEKNFKQFYLSIDPAELFVSNGFKILAMGPDCQNDMYELADALVSLIENKPDEASMVMYEIYHLFNDLTIESVDSITYEAYFKEYVDKYVKNTDLIKCEEGDVIHVKGIDIDIEFYDEDHNSIDTIDSTGEVDTELNIENEDNKGEA